MGRTHCCINNALVGVYKAMMQMRPNEHLASSKVGEMKVMQARTTAAATKEEQK